MNKDEEKFKEMQIELLTDQIDLYKRTLKALKFAKKLPLYKDDQDGLNSQVDLVKIQLSMTERTLEQIRSMR